MELYGGEDVEIPEPVDEEFLVLPENWRAVQLFQRCATQWRVGAMGGFFGLDYSAVESLIRVLRVKKPRRVFAQIQIMEIAALSVLNKRKK